MPGTQPNIYAQMMAQNNSGAPTSAPATPPAPAAQSGAQPQNIYAQMLAQQAKPAPSVPAAPVQSPGYQQAAQQAQGTLMNTPAGEAGLSVANGATFGQAPRIAGAIHGAAQYLENAVTGGAGQPTATDAYGAYRDAAYQDMGQFSQAHPVGSVALNLVGGLPSGVAEGKLIAAAPSMLSRIAASVGIGAAAGAAYGAGGNQNDPAAGAVSGASIGAPLGLAAPVLAPVGRVMSNAGRNILNAINPETAAATANQRAAQAVTAQLLSKGITSAGLVQASPVPVANGGQTIAEMIGQNGTGLAAALTRKPGATGDLANDVLGARQDGRTDRILQGFAQATGVDPNAARTAAEALVQQGRDSVNPAYTAIRADPSPVMTPGLQNLMQTDPNIQNALAKVNSVTRNAPLVPTASTWLAVRQQLADGVERNPATGAPMNNYNNQQMGNAASDLGDELKTAIPGFEGAQAKAALYKAPQASFDAARGMLFGGTATQTPADVQSLWDAAATGGQKQAIQHAFAADLLDKATNRAIPIQPSVLASPGVQQKLGIVFGPDAAANVKTMAQNEANMSKFASRVMPNNNSVTAEAQNHGNGIMGAVGQAALHAAPHAVTGGADGFAHAALAFAKSLAGNAIGTVKANNDQAFRDSIGKLYLGNASEFTPAYASKTASTRSISVPLGVSMNAANQTVAGQQ